MATAGYSGTPLLKKLGITPLSRLLLVNPPQDYYDLLEMDVSDQLVKGRQVPDIVHLFAADKTAFEKAMKKILPLKDRNSSLAIWVSWYKKSCSHFKDLTEDMIRGFALQHGLVDVKVCAVSDEWSGLKLVVPVSKR